MPLSSFSEWHGIYINEIDMEKEDIIKNILSVCNDMGVSFHKKVKTDKWKADIVVDYQNYKVACRVSGGNFTLPSLGTVLDSLPSHGSSHLTLLFISLYSILT